MLSAAGQLIGNKFTTSRTDVQVEIDGKVIVCKVHAQQVIPVT